jgi:hypothetical protein
LTASLAAFSTGTRVAGIIVALGFLLGLVDGSIVAVVGGLTLITLGRAVLLDRWEAALSGASLAIAAGALGVAAVRWEIFDLEALRDVQSVLGPTVAVEPVAAATAAALAAGAAVLAVGLWLGAPRAGGRLPWLWSAIEGSVAALALVTAFWGPALPGRDTAGAGGVLAGWVVGVCAVLAVLGILLWAQPRIGLMWRWVVLGSAALAVFAAAGLMASTG